MNGPEAYGQRAFLCTFSMYFVFNIFNGPLWAVMAAVEAHLNGLGSLSGLQAAILSRSRGLCGRSWAALRGSVGGLGLLLRGLGLSWGPCGRSLAAVGPSGGGRGLGTSPTPWCRTVAKISVCFCFAHGACV